MGCIVPTMMTSSSSSPCSLRRRQKLAASFPFLRKGAQPPFVVRLCSNTEDPRNLLNTGPEEEEDEGAHADGEVGEFRIPAKKLLEEIPHL